MMNRDSRVRVIAAWLVRTEGITREAAINQIIHLSPENQKSLLRRALRAFTMGKKLASLGV